MSRNDAHLDTVAVQEIKRQATLLKKAARAGDSHALRCIAATERRREKPKTSSTAGLYRLCLDTLADDLGFHGYNDLEKCERAVGSLLDAEPLSELAPGELRILAEEWRASHFKRGRYLAQIAALNEALRSGRPLREVADAYNISFCGFYFSLPLHNLLIKQFGLDARHRLSFQSLDCQGCVIEASWNFLVRDFREARLSGTRFITTTAEPEAMPGGWWANADFTGADLRFADLRRCYLRGVSFKGADARHTDLRDAWTGQCDFRDAAADGLRIRYFELSSCAYPPAAAPEPSEQIPDRSLLTTKRKAARPQHRAMPAGPKTGRRERLTRHVR